VPDIVESPDGDPPGGEDSDPDRPVIQLSPPISDTAWSPEFVMQSIEILPVFLAEGVPHWAKPIHAESYRVGWPASRAPGEVVLDTLARLGFDPLLAHSTSWRHEEGRIVLTYVAVIREPEFEPDGPIVPVPVGHAELARGDEFAPPPEIAVTQVVEHAFRHLSWLVKDDPVVKKSLADWVEALATYEPEPFRTLVPPRE
jgi:hypothetical protein